MEGDARQPIEVELVAHEPLTSRGGRWRREHDPAGDEPTDQPDQPDQPQSDRTRLVTTAAVVAVLAVALGWLLGRATTAESDVGADDALDRMLVTTTIEATPLATLPIVGEEIDGAEFADPAADDPSRLDVGATTTEVLAPTTEPIEVDERLAGLPIRLVGVELGGVLVEVDLMAGTHTDFGAARISRDGIPLVIGPDWVVASSAGRTRVIRSDGTESTLDLGDRRRTLHLPGTEWFWRVDLTSQRAPSSPRATLVGLDGEPVGPTIDLPADTWPAFVDPATGGLVVGNTPRNFAITPDGPEYLGVGDIIGITDDVLVTYDCDETFVCSLVRTDRVTGEVTVVPPDPELTESYRWQSTQGWGGPSDSALSPDGRWLAVIGSTFRSTVAGIVELASGRFVELSRDTFPATVAWAPDGRWVFTLVAGEVTAYDTVTGERFAAFTDVVQWLELGGRPLFVTTPDAGAEGATLLSASPEQPVEG